MILITDINIYIRKKWWFKKKKIKDKKTVVDGKNVGSNDVYMTQGARAASSAHTAGEGVCAVLSLFHCVFCR